MPFEIIRNDITRMHVDAIVNAANSTLLGGGGVDGAIHHAAGPELLDECRTLGGCQTGEAKITKGYLLPARYVIHTVGPIWSGGGNGEKELLQSCYRNSLLLALEHGCESVAFPLISAGVYGYPKDQAMAVASDTISQFLTDHDMMVYLVVFGAPETLISKQLFRDVQEYIDDVYAEAHITPNVSARREQLWRENREKALLFEQELMRPTQAPAPETPKKKKGLFHKRTEPAVPVDGAAPEESFCLQSSAFLNDGHPDWDSLLRQTDEGFSDCLMRLIDERGLTDAQCYKRANVDRKLFSKIRSNLAYRPSKPTVFAFAVALELSLPQTKELLDRAGFSLTHSSKFDIILEYFILHRQYNLFEINQVLFQFDMPLLGSGMN